MKLRWSNGHSFAVEFDSGPLRGFAAQLEGAMIDFRRQGDPAYQPRMELHVESGSGIWLDPVFPPAPDAPDIEFPGCKAFRMARRTHVIQTPRVQADPRPEPQVRGTDWVLVIGPGNWHADAVYAACRAAAGYCSRLSGLVDDVTDRIPQAETDREDGGDA